jgi:hypothetical protein
MDDYAGFQRDAPLSLRWELPEHQTDFANALGLASVSRTFTSVVFALARESIISGLATSYSRRAPHYCRPKIYTDDLYTYRKVVSAVELLDSLGLIEHDKAPPLRLGRQSTMRGNADLMHLALPFLVQGVQVRKRRTCLLLKDSDKNLVGYKRSRSIDAMSREMTAFNEALLSIDLGPAIACRTLLVRIFNNGSFSQGGRFYAEGGGWQTLSKEERQKLTISGDPVVEIDYSELHPTLAYHNAGLMPPEDAYDIHGYPRPLVKFAFNIMLNASTEHAARRSLALKPGMLNHLVGREVFRSGSPEKLMRQVRTFDPGLYQLALESAADLINQLRRKHSPIAVFFFSGLGPKLQHLDSQIASMVMKTMRKQGEMPLPVHDSFIVRTSQGDRLEQAMIEAGERKGIRLTCKRSSIVSMG